MNRTQSKLTIWALALMTCLAFGGQSAFASNVQPRVHAEGFFFQNDFPANPNPNGDQIKFGLNGRCTNGNGTATDTMGNITCNGTKDLGEYDYQNQFTGLKAHGKLQTVVFEPNGDPDCAGSTGATGPAATVKGGGACTDTLKCGTHQYQFEMTVVDDDDTPATEHNPDAVCKVFVYGYTKDKAPAADANPGTQLVKGDVEVVTTGNH